MTHNLGDFQLHRVNPSAPVESYARAFQDWLYRHLQAGDDEPVLTTSAWHRTPRAHPSPERFLPLCIALGAAGRKRRAERVYEEMRYGVLAMDAYVFEAV